VHARLLNGPVGPLANAARAAIVPLAALLTLAAALVPAPQPPDGSAEPTNRYCPVMTDREAQAEHFADYEGRRVYFCCRMCMRKFQKDPQAYLSNLEHADEPRPPRDADAAGADSAADIGSASAESSRSAAQLATAVGIDAETLNGLLFAADNEELFVKRRKLRLRQLPSPPDPPAVNGPLAAAVFNAIDRFVVAKWQAAALPQAESPPPVCDDVTFIRRVYLDLIGVIPTIAELERFLRDSSADKRAKLVDELLARDEDYAAHWTAFWLDALGSATTTLQGGIPTRGDYRQWVFDSFKANKPYDVMVAELIDPGMPGHKATILAEANTKKSQVGFIRNETHTDTLQTAANVGQVFLGTAMKCASCHSHFLNNEWPQQRFLGFAGLFAPSDLELIRCEQRTGEMVAACYPFDVPGAPRDAPQDVNARLRRAAQLTTDPLNPRFAKAIVNRLWKRYLGLGLFEPADDFRLDQPPSHPELLEWLAHDCMQHGYDLKHTIRLILTSHTYQLRYDPELEDHFDVAKPTEPRYFRSPALRRLTAEQLIDSIRLAMSQELRPQRRLYLDKTSTALTRALGKPASRNEISTARPEDVAVVQALELLNGEEYRRLIYAGRLLDELGRDRDAAGIVSGLYAAALSRPATAVERQAAIDFLRPALLSERESQASAAGREHDAQASASGSGGGDVLASAARSAAMRPREIDWLDDELPAGAMPSGSKGGASWKWVERGGEDLAESGGVSRSEAAQPESADGLASPDRGAPSLSPRQGARPPDARDTARPEPRPPVAPFRGKRMHMQAGETSPRAQHYALGAEPPLDAGPEDTLFAYVYIDPADPPKEIMLQWYAGDWEHRAYWGEDLIPFGESGTPSRLPMGVLPAAGQWVRLEVRTADVAISSGITGMSFDQAGGRVYWDDAGVVDRPENPAALALGDVLWALFTSPEFQYVR